MNKKQPRNTFGAAVMATLASVMGLVPSTGNVSIPTKLAESGGPQAVVQSARQDRAPIKVAGNSQTSGALQRLISQMDDGGFGLLRAGRKLTGLEIRAVRIAKRSFPTNRSNAVRSEYEPHVGAKQKAKMGSASNV